MANFLVRDGRVRNLGQLRAFSTGFCGRISSFDWVDIGVGKEGGAGRKVRGTTSTTMRPQYKHPILITHIENLTFYTTNTHLRHVILACSPLDIPAPLLSTLPLDKITLIESLPLPTALTSLPVKIVKFPSLFTPPPPARSPKMRGRNTVDSGRLQLTQQEDPDGGATWLVIRPERSKSQGAGLRRRERERDDDEESSLSISIGPDNTVSVDSGRRRRQIMDR